MRLCRLSCVLATALNFLLDDEFIEIPIALSDFGVDQLLTLAKPAKSAIDLGGL
jgi:hypothetical protein